MKQKPAAAYWASLAATAAALAVMAVHHVFLPLPDWAVRTAGVALLAALPVLAFCAARRSRRP